MCCLSCTVWWSVVAFLFRFDTTLGAVSDVVIVYSVRCIGMYGSSFGDTLFNIGGIRSGASSGFGCVVIRDEDDVGVENNTNL